jgi:hypothetical protein
MGISKGANFSGLGGDSPRLMPTSEKSRFTTMRQARRSQTKLIGNSAKNKIHVNATLISNTMSGSRTNWKALPV